MSDARSTLSQSLEVAGISFDLIIIRIWTGVSAEQTQAFAAAADVAPHGAKLKAKSQSHRASVHSVLTDLDALDLHIVVSSDDIADWRAKGVERV